MILAAGRVRWRKNKIGKKQNTKKSASSKTRYDIHSSPAIATASRRRPMKHVRRVSQSSPGSIDPGFVEIILVQLSQSVKMTNVHRQIK